MIKVINDGNRPWLVRFVFDGDKYGLNNCKTHAGTDPLVEFYDCRHEFTEYGQFVSRYYASTLLEGFGEAPDRGLCLDGGVPEWGISAEAYFRVRTWIRATIAHRTGSSPVDRAWLSQYIGSVQQLMEEGKYAAAHELLCAAEFNDRIYYTT